MHLEWWGAGRLGKSEVQLASRRVWDADGPNLSKRTMAWSDNGEAWAL